MSKAVLVSDMQPLFLYSKDLRLRYNGEQRRDLITNVSRVVGVAAAYQIPIVFVEYQGRGRTIKELQTIFRQVHGAKPPIRIPKSDDDAFTNPKLEEVLYQGTTKREIIGVGINASACLKKTCRTAKRRGFSVVTSLDLTMDPQGVEQMNRSENFYRAQTTLLDSVDQVLRYLIEPANPKAA